MKSGFDSNVARVRPRRRTVGVNDDETATAAATAPESSSRERARSALRAMTAAPVAPVADDAVVAAAATVAAADATRDGDDDHGAAQDWVVERLMEAAEDDETAEAISADPGLALRLAAAADEAGVREGAAAERRRERLRERVRDAARPDPGAGVAGELSDAEAVMELVRDLRARLEETIARADRAEIELDRSRRQLATAARENRELSQRTVALEKDLTHKGELLAELVGELDLLEDERNGALQQVQDLQVDVDGLSARASELDERLAASEREVAETRAAQERLGAQLDARGVELAAQRHRLERALSDAHALREALERQRRENAELTGTREALEDVRRALGEARSAILRR
jgi:chromosome segregation ATPase